ncbi:MAG: T6SS immunity protein Tli4 family protein [Telluria sp.]
MLKGIPMHLPTTKWLLLVPLTAAVLFLTSCDHNPKEWRTPNMTALTPRLQPVFEKTKTVCFGRFMIDVPASATVVWGKAIVPLTVTVYPNGVGEVKALAQKFIDELKGEKAIYHNRIPLLISVDDVSQPEGRIITGFDGFEAIDDLKINGYFKLNDDGVVINARPLKDQKDETIADINSIVRRLRQHTESEIPTEPGNCIEYAFLLDKPNPTQDDLLEHIRIGFRLKEFPDAHLSIYVAPSNPYNPQDDSLERQWKRIAAGTSPEEKAVMANTNFFRKSPREIHDWHTGFEVLTRTPDEEGSLSHHDFQLKFIGVPHDVLRPYADIQFVTGVADDAAGATKASLTDEEAIAVWDKITSTIRVRPTRPASVKTAEGGPQPLVPLGELAATGRTCPQTGWWELSEAGVNEGAHRQHLKAGDRMPHLMEAGEPSIWQKLKGQRPTNRTATTWKLVAYDDEPTRANGATQAPPIAQASPESTAAKNATGGMIAAVENDESSPKKG